MRDCARNLKALNERAEARSQNASKYNCNHFGQIIRLFSKILSRHRFLASHSIHVVSVVLSHLNLVEYTNLILTQIFVLHPIPIICSKYWVHSTHVHSVLVYVVSDRCASNAKAPNRITERHLNHCRFSSSRCARANNVSAHYSLFTLRSLTCFCVARASPIKHLALVCSRSATSTWTTLVPPTVAHTACFVRILLCVQRGASSCSRRSRSS